MIVKFIVTENKIVFGVKSYKEEQHRDIAEANGVFRVLAGGLADLKNCRIFGTSYGFGPYDPEKIRQMLPGWLVEIPSDYD